MANHFPAHFDQLRALLLAAAGRAGIFVPTGSLFFTLKLTIMSAKFALIGAVSLLGVGVAMHHARFCPLYETMKALHHQNAKTVSVKAVAATPAKGAATVATR